MNELKIQGKTGYIIIEIEDMDGVFYEKNSYENINGNIEIKSNCYFAKGKISFHLSDILSFYKELLNIYDDLEGEVEFCSFFPGEFSIKIIFLKNGHIKITGIFKENYAINNVLEYTITSDQSFLNNTIKDIRKILER